MSGNGETAETIHKAGKVHLTDNLRLMADNQRTLDVTNAADKRVRDLHARTEEAMAQERTNNLAAPQQPVEEEDMQIRVDSPTTTTVNHHYPPELPKIPKLAGTIAKAAIVAALLGTGAGAGVMLPWALGMFNQPAAVELPVDENTRYESGIRVY